MGTSGPAFPEVLAARTSPDQLFSEVIDLRLQSVELFLGRIAPGPRNSQLKTRIMIRYRKRTDTNRDLARNRPVGQTARHGPCIEF